MANLYKSINIREEAGKNEGYLPYLDGLRGIAILLVLLGHYFDRSFLADLAWTGVNLFFILSGYLITWKLMSYAPGGKGYFKNFYTRRILRIFPLYYGVLVFFFLALPFIYGNYNKNFSELRHTQIWYWLYVNNWKLYLYGFRDNLSLMTFWSLAVEEQFYLLWPIPVRYLGGQKLKIFMTGLLVASIFGRVVSQGAYLVYFSTLTACEPLLIGAFLYIARREGRIVIYYKYIAGAALAALIVLAAIMLHQKNLSIRYDWSLRLGYSAVDCIMAFLLAGSLTDSRTSVVLRGIFSRKWLVWLGKYSYAIYVFHWLFLQTFILKAEKTWSQGGMNGDLSYLLSRIVGMALVLAASYASFHLYEKHFLRLKQYFTDNAG